MAQVADEPRCAALLEPARDQRTAEWFRRAVHVLGGSDRATTMRLIVPLFLALCAAPACLGAQADVPDADEYAVWSAVLDSVATWDSGRRVADSAFVPRVVRDRANEPIIAAGMELQKFDSAAIQDFLAKNQHGVRIEARFFSRPVSLARTPVGEGWAASLDHTLIFISRPGFDPTRTKAVVHTSSFCGIWCGWGESYQLERTADGAWRVQRKERSWLS